jgi:putative transposase
MASEVRTFCPERKTTPRQIRCGFCSTTLGDDFMKQIARNQTDPFDGLLKDKKYVLMDRDSNFSAAFRTVLKNADVEPVRLPARSPDLNPQIERFHLSVKSECLSRMIFFGEKSLRRAVNIYLDHYHEERNHQGLENQIIEPRDEGGRDEGEVACRERLGGLLRYYYRDAA